MKVIDNNNTLIIIKEENFVISNLNVLNILQILNGCLIF